MPTLNSHTITHPVHHTGSFCGLQSDGKLGKEFVQVEISKWNNNSCISAFRGK